MTDYPAVIMVSTEAQQGPLVRRTGKIFSVLVGLALFAAIALPLVLWLEHRMALTLPQPTGPYAVGRVETDWSDPETPDELAPEAGAHRHLVVWIWYPATETSHGTS